MIVLKRDLLGPIPDESVSGVYGMNEYAGKTYLVIGASSGIGYCISKKLASLSANVLLLARNEEKLKRVLDSLPDGKHESITFDVSNITGISRLADSIFENHSVLDGVIYCVGNGDIVRLRDNIFERIHNVMITNFYAFIEFVRIITNKKNKKQRMHIIGISSLASTQSEKYFTSYASSKAAMEAAVRCLALELINKNTTINTIRPGVVKTHRLDHLNDVTGDIEEKIKQNGFQPMGLIPPEEVAELAIYLLGNSANFITGASLPVNGGAIC